MKFVSRLFSEYAIQIRGGSARCVKGKMLGRVMSDISSLASENNIQEGEIWINQAGRVSFSSEIPNTIHQRIRNVVSSR
jgi:hypothetical protein